MGLAVDCSIMSSHTFLRCNLVLVPVAFILGRKDECQFKRQTRKALAVWKLGLEKHASLVAEYVAWT